MSAAMDAALEELVNPTQQVAFRAAYDEGLFGSGDPEVHLAEFRDRYQGLWPSAGEYASNLTAETHHAALDSLPVEVRTAIDWAHAAMQMEANGLFLTVADSGGAVHVFLQS